MDGEFSESEWEVNHALGADGFSADLTNAALSMDEESLYAHLVRIILFENKN
jgi:hypothetical protein